MATWLRWLPSSSQVERKRVTVRRDGSSVDTNPIWSDSPSNLINCTALCLCCKLGKLLPMLMVLEFYPPLHVEDVPWRWWPAIKSVTDLMRQRNTNATLHILSTSLRSRWYQEVSKSIICIIFIISHRYYPIDKKFVLSKEDMKYSSSDPHLFQHWHQIQGDQKRQGWIMIIRFTNTHS